jgi:hypothetical protein
MSEESNFEDEESLGKKICPASGSECCGKGDCDCGKEER